jgi:hypothetical protein
VAGSCVHSNDPSGFIKFWECRIVERLLSFSRTKLRGVFLTSLRGLGHGVL